MNKYTSQDLHQELINLDVIPREKLDSAYESSEKEGKSFEDVLAESVLISSENLGKVIANLISTPFVNLSEITVEKDILNIIPEIVARKQKIIAFRKDRRGLHIAMADPTNTQTVAFLEKKTGIPIIIYYATKKDIGDSLALYRKDVKKAYEEIINENIQNAQEVKKKDPSIIKIVDTTISYAYQNKASDIHIEPYEGRSLIRFRIDGILHDIVDLPKELQSQIVTRVKVLAKLRTDEHQTAQDGKISYKVDEDTLDIRVSIVPVTYGEKVVMRLLSERSTPFSLKDLGLDDADLKKLEQAYKKPHGMILATGPTGSGKTTTLYEILKILNRREVNIMTIEDPIEYDIEGVNQIQVNEKTSLTFANGLRSIVRQDPNIILVGEIRDEETSDIAVNAAMTGHLLLSTLHTNDAATTIPRLLDFGVEPFLIASTLNIIIGQRLVRRICNKCRYSSEIKVSDRDKAGIIDAFIKKYYGDSEKIRVYKGRGCPICHSTGYVGRIGIFEVLVVDDEVREVIIAKKDASEIRALAIKKGMMSMFEDGVKKVKEGITTIEEILRVTKE